MINLMNAKRAARGNDVMSISRIKFLVLWNIVSHFGVSVIEVSSRFEVAFVCELV